jgi:hypothetical protein
VEKKVISHENDRKARARERVEKMVKVGQLLEVRVAKVLGSPHRSRMHAIHVAKSGIACRSKGYAANELEYDDGTSSVVQPVRQIGGIGWSICTVGVEQKTGNAVQVKNKFQALAENGGYPEDEEFDKEFKQKEAEDGEFVKEIMQSMKKDYGNHGVCGSKKCGHFEGMKKAIKGKVRFEKMPKPTCQKDKRSLGKQSPELEINNVEGEKKKSRITIDSGAEESVWPIEQIGDHELVETEASRNGIGFVAANGAKMKNFGAL